MNEKHISIQGTVYDKKTGLPLRTERGTNASIHRPAQAVHAQPQKSQTLHRKYVSRDHSSQTISRPTITPRRTIQAPLIPRSEAITRHAKETVAAMPQPRKVINDFGPAKHPLVAKVETRSVAPAQRTVKPSDILKKEAIDKAMADIPTKRSGRPPKAARKQNKFSQAMSVASASLAIVLLGGYLTYINMPSLSTRVAAAQAGVNATYPGYHPSGYSLAGPVAYEHGTVTMKFAANASPQSFTLTQSQSGWDSPAVLDHYVTPEAGDDYSTTAVNGLTIYHYKNTAAWVNGGILYTISGDAPLSSEQVQGIATSL